MLTALLITRSKVVGINCFGFGGRVIAKEGEEDWEQIMNGIRTTFPSPIQKNRNQEKIVRQVLEEVGFADTEVEIVGVFTSPNVWLSDAAGSNCYTKDNAMKYLKSESFLADRGLDPQKIEAALEPRIVRAKNQKDAKNEEIHNHKKGGYVEGQNKYEVKNDRGKLWWESSQKGSGCLVMEDPEYCTKVAFTIGRWIDLMAD